jgi:hypothetical membrane protein
VVPLLEALVNAFVGARHPHYDFLRDYVSDLAAQGQPDSEALCVLWGAFPLLFGPFAVVVYAGLRGHPFGRVTPTLLGLFALFIGLCGIFRYDPDGPLQSFSSRAHVLVSTLASTVLVPDPFFLWLATRRDPSWERFRKFSLLVQAAGMVPAILLALAFLQVLAWRGFAEWCLWGVYYAWIGLLALKLQRMVKGRATGEFSREMKAGEPAAVWVCQERE